MTSLMSKLQLVNLQKNISSLGYLGFHELFAKETQKEDVEKYLIS